MITRRACIGSLVAVSAGSAAVGLDGQKPHAVADGLRFPEGPVALANGTVLVSEIAAGQISSIAPGGRRQVIARTGGGPNGLAAGPGGMLFSCNNGGFAWSERDGRLMPAGRSSDNAGGRIDRIDPVHGRVEMLYGSAKGLKLSAPNDLVFDGQGGFYFTDHGHVTDQAQEHGSVWYARADGREIRQILGRLSAPNGIALSPDGRTLYVALTLERQVLAFTILAPGRVTPTDAFAAPIAADLPGRRYIDSMKVEADGSLCMAMLVEGGVRTFVPFGQEIGFVPVPDFIVTNLCFGGSDMRDAWICAGTTGRLFRVRWPGPGLRLAHQSAEAPPLG